MADLRVPGYLAPREPDPAAETPPAPAPQRYRVGRHLGRTIYDEDTLIGIMDTPELGALVVEALNTRDRVLKTWRRG